MGSGGGRQIGGRVALNHLRPGRDLRKGCRHSNVLLVAFPCDPPDELRVGLVLHDGLIERLQSLANAILAALRSEVSASQAQEPAPRLSALVLDCHCSHLLTPNDLANTQFLAGVMQDVEEREQVMSVEASRRFGDHWRLSLEAWFFLSTPEDSRLYYLRDDDFVRLEMAYYF